MAQLLVRDLEPEVVRALKRRAAEEGTSVEEAHLLSLRDARLRGRSSLSSKETLVSRNESEFAPTGVEILNPWRPAA